MSLDAIGIISSDIKKSTGFYKVLGVNLSEAGSPDHYAGTTPSGVRLMVDSVDLMKSINPDWKMPIGSGVILCFKQESPQKVDEIFSKIVNSGFEQVKEPWDAFWGQRYCVIEDPDGYKIDLYAYL